MPDESDDGLRPLPPEVDLRVLQANERTLLAWIRTGIALTAFGFVVARLGVFLRHMEPAARDQVGLSMFIGAALVVLGSASTRHDVTRQAGW